MSSLTVQQTSATAPLLKLYLAPDEPIEVGELTNALDSLAHQYQVFVEKDGILGRSTDARLLVWNVSPGSIDIALLPDLQATAGLLATAYDPFKHLLDFAEQLKRLMEFFSSSENKSKEAPERGITVRDCEDVTNIAAPITNHGGRQSVTVINGDVIVPILAMDVEQARQIAGNAQQTRFALASRQVEVRQCVPLVWKRLDRGKARTESLMTPDRALIEEIDKRDRPTFFTNETSDLKDKMIGDDENPWRRVYFVDVEVSRVDGKVVSYRIIGYHGKTDLD